MRLPLLAVVIVIVAVVFPLFPAIGVTSAVVMVPAIIPVVVMVPMVIVFDAAVLAFPIAIKEPFPIVMGVYPASTGVRRPSPITFVPPVVPSHRIPIALHPYEFRAWSWRQNVNHARRRRRANLDANRNLCSQCR